MKLTIPEIVVKDQDGFSPELDIFQRKEFGERLASLIENSDENLVIALDAKWGEGKSTFIKMWKGYIAHQRDNKLKSIYFDAFENDYQKDPFLALASEIYGLLKDEGEEKQKEFRLKAGAAVKSMTRGAVKIGVKALSGGILDGSSLDSVEKDISTLLSNQVDQLVADKLKHTEEDKLALKSFKTYLETFSSEKGEGQPIVFVIDELDRCRPDFALELLEKIKHLFSVKGITFLLVMNREQLEESVKARYGTGVNSSLYLQKFINLWVTLPRKSGKHMDNGVRYFRSTLNAMLSQDETCQNTDATELLSQLVEYLKPSYREIERILSYFSIIQNSSGNTAYYSIFQIMFAFMCYIKASDPGLVLKIQNGEVTSKDIFKRVRISELLDDPETDYYYIRELANWIIFDLANDEERKKMIDERVVILDGMGRIHKDVMVTVCTWLAEMNNKA